MVFHTKFLSDFISEVAEECQREQHYGNAFYYKIFSEKIKEDSNMELYHAQSVKFRDFRQLVDLGLMKNSPAFEDFVQSILQK